MNDSIEDAELSSPEYKEVSFKIFKFLNCVITFLAILYVQSKSNSWPIKKLCELKERGMALIRIGRGSIVLVFDCSGSSGIQYLEDLAEAGELRFITNQSLPGSISRLCSAE